MVDVDADNLYYWFYIALFSLETELWKTRFCSNSIEALPYAWNKPPRNNPGITTIPRDPSLFTPDAPALDTREEDE
jgi:hypothetical protein